MEDLPEAIFNLLIIALYKITPRRLKNWYKSQSERMQKLLFIIASVIVICLTTVIFVAVVWALTIFDLI